MRCIIEMQGMMDQPYNVGLCSLFILSYTAVSAEARSEADTILAQGLAANLVIDCVKNNIVVDPKVLVRIVDAFVVQLVDIGQVLEQSEDERKMDEEKIAQAKALIVPYILNLADERKYTIALQLLKNFDIRDCTPIEFLGTVVDRHEVELAGEWAAHLEMGKDKHMLSFLVKYRTDKGDYEAAYNLVERYQLSEDFPQAYQQYKRSSIQKYARKRQWHAAATIAIETHLQEYLLDLATEEGCRSEIVGLLETVLKRGVRFRSGQASVYCAGGYVPLGDVFKYGAVWHLLDCDRARLNASVVKLTSYVSGSVVSQAIHLKYHVVRQD